MHAEPQNMGEAYGFESGIGFLAEKHESPARGKGVQGLNVENDVKCLQQITSVKLAVRSETGDSDGKTTDCPTAHMVANGDSVLVRLERNTITGVIVAMTQQVCVVRVDHVAEKRFRLKADRLAIDPATLSDSAEWPPALPPDFPLAFHVRGYQARINGSTRWICGKVSPRQAYAAYLRKYKAITPKRLQTGDHAAYPWSLVYRPVVPSAATVGDLLRRSLPQWAYAPTTSAPDSIAKVKDLFAYSDFTAPCVYFLCFQGHVVYVGQTAKLKSRISDHATDKKFDAVFFRPAHPNSIDRVERNFIRRLRPVYNGSFNPSRSEEKRFEHVRHSAPVVFRHPAHVAARGGRRLQNGGAL